MKIVDESLLDQFRCRPCEFCGQGIGEAAHVYAKGIGGGLRLDHRLNVLSLCRDCHQRHHNGGVPQRVDLIDIVARREGMEPHEVVEELRRLQRADRHGREPNRKPSWESAT